MSFGGLVNFLLAALACLRRKERTVILNLDYTMIVIFLHEGKHTHSMHPLLPLLKESE